MNTKTPGHQSKARRLTGAVIALCIWLSISINAQEPVQAPVKTPHPLAQQLFNSGSVTCAAKANQIAGFLSDGSETFMLQNPIGDPDRNLLSAAVVYGEKSKSKAAFITLAPNQANGCGATYQTLTYFEEDCRKTMMGKDFSADKIRPIGKTNANFMPLTQTARLLFVNMGRGCLLIKHEVVN